MATNDSFTETTTRGWGSRIKGALAGVLFGPLLILGSIWLLSWNEGRAIRTATALSEGRKSVVAISSDAVSPANEGKLVYLTGKATTDETLQDEELEVQQNVLMLRRHTEMYQWIEKKESSSSKNLGGSETTTTKYTYSKDWKDSPVDSSDFKKPQEPPNPPEFSYPSETWVAQKAKIGAFGLSEDLVQSIGGEQELKLKPNEDAEEDSWTVYNGDYYIGEDPKNPQIGDLRISYYVTPLTEVSVVAAQVAGSLVPYTAKNGSSIALIQAGVHSADSLFTDAEKSNSLITWLVRLGGTLLCFIGFSLIMNPLSVLGDVVPFIGTIIGFGTGLVSFLLGLSVSALTIAIAWIAYRPFLAGALVLGVILLVVFVMRRKRRQVNLPTPAR